MKRASVIFFSCFLLCCLPVWAQTTKGAGKSAVQVDSAVRVFLGDDLARLLMEAKEIRPYIYDSNKVTWWGYHIQREGKKLSKAQADTLKAIISSGDSYYFNGYVKNSRGPYTVGFIFKKGKEEVFMGIHLYSLKWYFEQKGVPDYKVEDCELAFNRMLPLLKAIFPEELNKYKPIEVILYKPKKKESIYTIASKFGVEPYTLSQWNGFEAYNYKYKKGRKIVIIKYNNTPPENTEDVTGDGPSEEN